MRHLAIDLWDKKVGIAIETENISIPKDIIARTKLVSYLKKTLTEYGITHIIVGLPYDLYGKDIRQLEKTQKFIEKLKGIFHNTYIIGYDERFTSFEAKKDIGDIAVVDDISASLILESYLRENI